MPLAPSRAEAEPADRSGAAGRANEAYRIRVDAAKRQRREPAPVNAANGDEAALPGRIGCYSKALPHNELGEVDLYAYDTLLRAVESGNADDFAAIPLGGTAKLANPKAALAFGLEGPDSHHIALATPPRFSSAWQGGEMVEVYWLALTRDVPFAEFDADPMIARAASELSRLSDFRGPREGGAVTTRSVFRGGTPGDLTGPYLSQFLWKDVPFGATKIVQRYKTTARGVEHMTAYADWLAIQRGSAPRTANAFDAVPRYIRNGRDLGEWVHQDFTYQGFLTAALILLSFGPGALDAANPYRSSANQGGFITFGGAHVMDLVARVANPALKASWCQKWVRHRRLRPEAFGGRVHNHLTGVARYPLHAEVLSSGAAAEVASRFGSFLLPMPYPEGSPTHPSYPAGHAAIAGACVTVLKAFFNESFVIPQPVEATSDGQSLVPYSGGPLTIGGELNKLASNIALGRDTAGVHYRSDGVEGMRLGEDVAIGILRDLADTYSESFGGLSLTKFDGTTIRI